MKKQKTKSAAKTGKTVLRKTIKSKRPAKKSKSSSVKTTEERVVTSMLHRISVNARRRAYNNSAPVTIIRDNKIIQIYRGKEKVIGRALPPRVLKNIPSQITIK